MKIKIKIPWAILRLLLSLVCGVVSLVLGTKLEWEKERPMLYAPWWVMILTFGVLGLACDVAFWYLKRYRQASLFGLRACNRAAISVISTVMLIVSFIEIWDGDKKPAAWANLAFDFFGLGLGLIDWLDCHQKSNQAQEARKKLKLHRQYSLSLSAGITTSARLEIPPPAARLRSY